MTNFNNIESAAEWAVNLAQLTIGGQPEQVAIRAAEAPTVRDAVMALVPLTCSLAFDLAKAKTLLTGTEHTPDKVLQDVLDGVRNITAMLAKVGLTLEDLGEPEQARTVDETTVDAFIKELGL